MIFSPKDIVRASIVRFELFLILEGVGGKIFLANLVSLKV